MTLESGTALDVVTGAFSYSGKYIAQRLLSAGRRVRTLTGHPDRGDVFGGRLEVRPYDFDQPEKLAGHLRGAETLYNTYWVRFSYGGLTYDKAIHNTLVLLQAAQRAGVRRIVHVSIAQPDERSPFAYYRGKAILEKAVRSSGLSYGILRPTVLFGPEDILINNIAWMVRRFPLFLVPGSGDYPVQPIFVEDLAELAVAAGASHVDEVTDAVGPEVFTYRELVQCVASSLGRRPHLVSAPASLVYGAARLLGPFLGDVVLTWEEILALQAGLLRGSPAKGRKRLSAWLAENKNSVGRTYRSEVQRHFDGNKP